jgi:hypothetical protein
MVSTLADGLGPKRLRLADRWPWADELTAAVTRLQASPPGCPTCVYPLVHLASASGSGVP